MVSPYFHQRFRMTERWEIVHEDSEGSAVKCNFFRDNFQIYCFRAIAMHLAMEKIATVYRDLRVFNYTVNLQGRKDVNDHVIARSIYYREIPAIITDFDGENGRVRVRSDSPGVSGFPPEPWDGEGADNEQDIWVDLLSPKIHWFREAA